uniref:Uncharacterized protein n=1 Tax=Arundo donax TaxID=35708 RepID=A0A0A9A2V2_ARUDO
MRLPRSSTSSWPAASRP